MFEPTALPVQRLPRQTLHHTWAPKLGRTIVLGGTAQLHLWAMLEAHPGVTRYCERPSWPGDEEQSPCPDFWALRDGKPVWLMLRDDMVTPDGDDASSGSAPGVETVTLDELGRHRVWIDNWLSLLPYLGASGWPELESLRKPVADFLCQEASFDEAEQHFAQFDSIAVRTAIIDGLHRGVLFSNELLMRPWDLRTRVARLSGAALHATQ